MDQILQKVDFNGNGMVDYSEFLAANVRMDWTEDRLQAAFEIFDKDGNGKISVEEIREAIGQEEPVEDD